MWQYRTPRAGHRWSMAPLFLGFAGSVMVKDKILIVGICRQTLVGLF